MKTSPELICSESSYVQEVPGGVFLSAGFGTSFCCYQKQWQKAQTVL